MMTVYDLKVGQKATIYDIAGDIRLAKRLFALGCINGTEIFRILQQGNPLSAEQCDDIIKK